MIRLRSKKLLSSVSAIAVLATFGAVDPVLAAGTTFPGPGNIPAINTQTDTTVGNRDFVNIDTNANVAVDGSGRSFYNPAGIIIGNTDTAVFVNNSILQGSIVNDGSLVSSGQDGIFVDDAQVLGRVINNNWISATVFDGIGFTGNSIGNGITNTSTILAGDTGIEIDTGVIFNGGIINSGVVQGSAAGIDIDPGASFSGGIQNNGTAAIIRGTSGDAINIGADSFTGGITNEGLIEGQSGDAIDINGNIFSGGINNAGSIAITTSGFTAINISGNLFQGGITNSGVIDAQTTSGIAINITGNTFQGGINNDGGQILSDTSAAIAWSGNLFQGGITNSGLIETDASSGTAITLSGGTFQGGINNQAAGSMLASGDVINFSGTAFEGGITNAGLIDSTGSGNAIDINGGSFSGGITNTGQLYSGASTDAVVITSTVFNGGIANDGVIVGASNGINVGTTFNGGINNQANGLINGWNTAGVNITAGNFSGGITNAGQIGGASTGTASIGILFGGQTFSGGINNSGNIQGSVNAIQLNGTSFTGGITNSGLIEGTGTENALLINTTTFAGGINNTGTGVIRGDTGINITTTVVSFDGGITNAGLIQGTSTSGVLISSTTFSGGINNTETGIIQSETNGLNITNSVTSFSGGITNAGLIQSTSGGIGVVIDPNTFSGGVNNTSTGSIKGLNATGLLITPNTFEGGVTNSGSISGDGAGVVINVLNFSGGFNNDGGVIQGTGLNGDGVTVTATNFTGDFSNSGAITGDTSDDGVEFNVENFFGNFTNTSTGTIFGGNRGVFLNGKLYAGNFSNAGSIDGGEGEGVRINYDLFAGDVTNTGTLTAENDALKITGGTTITGDVANDGGVIISRSSDAVDINGVVQGAFTNTGTMHASGNALDLDGIIQGNIFNSGTMLSWGEGAVDLTNEGAAHTITQTAGGFISDSGGEGNYAINMSNGFVDTFFANGGAVEGDIIGGGGEGDNMTTQSGTFAWWRGTGSGLDQFDVDGGTSILGAMFRGDGGGEGVFVNTAESMNVDGWVYLDDDTTININNGYVQGPTGTVEYFLTTNTGVHGAINANSTNLDGNIAAFLDPVSFAAAVIPTTSTLFYDDVLNSANNRTGTFDNTASILTSSIFFSGFASYDGDGDVDLNIQRIAFNDALDAIGAAETQNQNSVAAAIETIYTNGGYSGDFQDFLELLFGGGLTGPQFQAILDDLSGAEHAQLQGSALALNGILGGFMTEQLDAAKQTQGGTHFASLEQRFAQATSSASDMPPPNSYGSHGLTRGQSGVSVWARVFGQWDHNDGDLEAPSFDQDTTGGALGIDYAIDNNAILGLAGDFANSDVDFDTPGDSADIDTWSIGAYGSYGFGHVYFDGMANYSSHDLSTVRTIFPPVPGAPFSTAAGYDATTWSLAGEIGSIWRMGRVDIQPSARLAWTSSDTDGFSESGFGPGGIFDLTVQSADADSLASTLALRASGVWTMGRTKVVPDIKVGWRHEFETDRYSFVAAFAEDPSTTFTIIGSGVQEDSAVVSAGAIFGVTANFEVFVDLNGNYGSDLSQTNASGGFRFTW